MAAGERRKTTTRTTGRGTSRASAGRSASRGGTSRNTRRSTRARTSYSSTTGSRRNGRGRGKNNHRIVRFLVMLVMGLVTLTMMVITIATVYELVRDKLFPDEQVVQQRTVDERPELDVELLEVNPYSRPGIALEQVNGIVVHYTANPGTSAMQNRDYFAGLAEEHTTKASSHFIIGLEGEIVQCIPCDEISYASNNRNKDTISIECCIEDESGKFNKETYNSLVELVSWLMGRYGLGTEDVIRHYDVTGKECPKYFVDHPDAWEDFHEDLVSYIAKNGKKKDN